MTYYIPSSLRARPKSLTTSWPLDTVLEPRRQRSVDLTARNENFTLRYLITSSYRSIIISCFLKITIHITLNPKRFETLFIVHCSFRMFILSFSFFFFSASLLLRLLFFTSSSSLSPSPLLRHRLLSHRLLFFSATTSSSPPTPPLHRYHTYRLPS